MLLIVISSEAGISQNVQVYDGFIDKMPITIFLNINNSKITGYYLYNKYGQPIPLEGEISGDKIKLTEFSSGNGKRNYEESATLIWNKSNASDGQWESKSINLPMILKKRHLSINWKLFDIKITLTHTLSGRQVHEYPVSFTMVYPAEEESMLFNSLASEIFELKPVYKGVMEYFNNFIKEIYYYYLIDYPPIIDKLDYYYTMNGEVVFLSESVFSYKVSGYGYAGGIHGQPIEEYYVFDLKKGTRITLDDIFKRNFESEIARLIHKKDNLQHNIEDIVKNLDNFYLTDKGIGFIFNPYDIDCYGCGTFEYFIDFDELRELLNK